MSVLLREGLCSKFSMDLPLAFLVQLIYLCLQTIKLPLYQSLSIPPLSLLVFLSMCHLFPVLSALSSRRFHLVSGRKVPKKRERKF